VGPVSDGRFVFEGRLLVVGGGRMGEAITKGLIDAGSLDAERVVIAEPDPQRRETLHATHHVGVAAHASEAVYAADIVLLAVKPQVLDGVVRELAGALGRALVVSIAAGVSIARLETLLPPGTPVVRVMPNTPAMVRVGMSVVSGGSEADAEHVDLVRSLFAELGDAIVLDERFQDAAGAISGCGPAYVALFVDALARAGVRHGLARDVAQRLAVQTLVGTAELIRATGQHPEQLIDAVTSPGGTTIAALEVLEARGFRAALADAVSAAVARSKELGA
jgi:pyrroline-5-carboxylate reductase